ncbi:alpha/beta hydrolase [Gordonia sp. CPCC 205515]|uniref:alpha/beta hydrolase n=1 Tax=Gordonia sp. CPCC 205515 TaxID=3140791 RepID=UPI003AF39A40
MDAVTFPSGPISMAGNLFTPADFDASKKYAALVTVHPGGGVKEQTAGLYASKFADEGFVTLAFDASFQGESGGEPHHLEDPYARVEDVRAAVDYLQSLDYVDSDRIGVVGICAGGGYAINAAMTDHRVNAVATVSALNIGTAWRQGWYGLDPDSAAAPMLDQVAQQRTAEAEGGEVATAPYVPAEPDDDTPYDLAQASEYYLTPRAQHPNAQNTYLLSASIPRIMGFDAFNLVEDLFTKPVIIVAGSEAGSLWHSTELHAKLNSTKKMVVVDGGTHMDFYDVPKYVDRAVSEIKPFLDEHLAAK